jgi:methyl-accepting chemotaxis protein
MRILAMYILSLTVIFGLTTLIASYSLSTSVSQLMVDQQSGKLHTLEKVLQSMGPLRVENGIFYAGNTVLNDNNSLVDDLKQRSGNEVTIFMGDTRVATTVSKDGKRLVGTKMSQPVIDAVLKNKKEYDGTANVVGISFLSSYIPLYGATGEVIGSLFVGIPRSTFLSIIYKVIFHTGLVCGPITLIFMFLTASLIGRALKPIGTVESKIQEAIKKVHQVEETIHQAATNSIQVAAHNADDANMVATGSQETTTQMTSVASATNQLSSSVDHILQHVNQYVSKCCQTG